MRKSLILAAALALCVVPCTAQDMNAAGATFPHPISKWSSEYSPNWMLDHGEAQVSQLAYAPLPGRVAGKVRTAVLP